MPGRGQPWKKGGHVDDTIDSGDIIDNTIKLEDLSTEVTDAISGASDGVGYDEVLDEGGSLPKRARLDFVGAGVTASDGIENTTTVTIAGGGGYDTIEEEGTPLTQRTELNFVGAGVTATDDGEKTVITIPGGLGGGGGGGSNDLEQAIVFEEDFFSNDQTQIHSPLLGQIGSGQTEGNGLFPIQVGGVFDTYHDNDQVGTLWGVEHGGTTNTFANFDFTGSDCIGKFGLGFNALTNMSAWVGFVDTFLANNQNPASIANIEAPLAEGAYFRWHSTTSGNWFAVTMNGGAKTETDTGVAVTSGNIIRLKITYTDATSVTFTIDEVDVATHTTNLPATDLGFVVAGASITFPNTNGDSSNPHGFDYIQIEQARSGATIGVGSGGASGSRFPDAYPLTEILEFDDFFYSSPDGLDQLKYGVFGNANLTNLTNEKTIGGVVELQGSGGVNGDVGGMISNFDYTEGGNFIDFDKDFDIKITTSLNALVNRIDWIGIMDDFIATGITVALGEAGFAEGAYFRAESGGNWIAVTRSSSTNTTTDTGVASSISNATFEIIKTGSSIGFKIAGATVATHTTNLPTGGTGLMQEGMTDLAVFQNLFHRVDSWYLKADR